MIEHAREQNTRILALTATPGQPDRVPGGKRAPYHERWQSLNRLKELVGVERIFPLNHPSNRVSLRPVWLKQFTHVTQAQENLTDMLRSLRAELFKKLNAAPSSRTGAALKKLFKDPSHEEIEFRSEFAMRELREAINAEYPEHGNMAQSIISSIRTLSALHVALESRGISSFIKDTLKLRLYQLFSPTPSSNYPGRSAVKPPLYISRLLDGAKLKAAFDSVAPKSVRHLWDSTALEVLTKESPSTWAKKSDTERKRLHPKLLKLVSDHVSSLLITGDYYDSPKERYIFHQLQKENKRTFIAVGRIDRAVFLAKRITTVLEQVAVPLTGTGNPKSPGISPKERAANLAKINSAQAKHLICTSCGQEGLDVVMDYGISEEYDTSERAATQRRGRVGRKVKREDSAQSSSIGVSGHYDLPMLTIRDYSRVLSILNKGIEVQEMLNRERSAFTNPSSIKAETDGANTRLKRNRAKETKSKTDFLPNFYPRDEQDPTAYTP